MRLIEIKSWVTLAVSHIPTYLVLEIFLHHQRYAAACFVFVLHSQASICFFSTYLAQPDQFPSFPLLFLFTSCIMSGLGNEYPQLHTSSSRPHASPF
jgi:hypothetical protein